MKTDRNSNLFSQIAKIEYARADMIDSDTPCNNENLQMIIPFGNRWNSLYFTPSSASLKQSSKRKNGVIVYQQTLSVKLPGYDGKESNEKNHSFYYSTSKAIRKALVLRITLCNNDVIIIGRENDPVRLSQEFNISRMITGGKIVFSRTSRESFCYEGLLHSEAVVFYDMEQNEIQQTTGEGLVTSPII